MSSTVRAYEVTIKVTFTTGAKELVQRVEHAYTPVDAVMQAILNTSADKGATQLVKTELVNVSVPQKLILESESDLLDNVARTVAGLLPEGE